MCFTKRVAVCTVAVVAAIALLSCLAGSVQAEMLFTHSGNADPTTEEWSKSSWWNLQDAEVGAVTGDPTLNAWKVDDSGDRTGAYQSAALTVDQQTRAWTQGWSARTRLRVVNQPDAVDGSVHINAGFPEGGAGYDRYFYLLFGSSDGTAEGEELGDPIVSMGGSQVTISGSGYHLYEMRFDTATKTVDLFVDGVEKISNDAGVDNYSPGHEWERDGAYFGADSACYTGRGHYNLVQFEIVPEPSTLVLLAVGVLGLLAWRLRRRRHPAN